MGRIIINDGLERMKVYIEKETVINVELLEKYKNEIIDKYVLQDHLNIIRLIKTDEYINNKLIIAKRNSYDIKNMSMIYSKVKAVRDLEKKYKIQPLQVDYKLVGDIQMGDNEYNYIKNVFRITREKPTNYSQLRGVYISMVRNISNNDLVKSERSMKKETRKQTLYSIDDDYIQYHLDLNKYTNTACTHFHDEFVTKYNIPVVKTSFHNNDEEYVEYDSDYIDEQCRLLDVIM